MELRETARMMGSVSYKERFIAEYWQTKIRYEKLKKFNNRIEAAEVWGKTGKIPVHDSPYQILHRQQSVMGEYLSILEVRAEIEEIDLDAPLKTGHCMEQEQGRGN